MIIFIIFVFWIQHPFNFLASLINGNMKISPPSISPVMTFNFLASLINGNSLMDDQQSWRKQGILLTS